MIDENIKDGDIILVRQQEVAENGQRVVALIDNYEATLKNFSKSVIRFGFNQQIVLMSRLSYEKTEI